MEPLIAAAGRALAAGDPLRALNAVALRDDAPALALRGLAMAQLGDLPRARQLLRRAARAFGPRDAVSRARCAAAEAEIALVSRDLAWPAGPLAAARHVLERQQDRANAAHARCLEARHRLLTGRLDEAEALVAGVDVRLLALPARVSRHLLVAGLAMRRLRSREAHAALAEAASAAAAAAVPSLVAEVEEATRLLQAPAARVLSGGTTRLVRIDAVEALLASGSLVVDACRRAVHEGDRLVPLATRPVLFALARTLAEAWPGGVSRSALLARVFRAKEADESHRARLRVEIGRLRRTLRGVAGVAATRDGYVLVRSEPAKGGAAQPPGETAAVAVLAPPSDEAHAALLALVGDGEAWSTSALALALGTSQRTVQRALDALAADDRVRAIGKGPAQRWMAPPVPGFPTSMLLPTALPLG